MLTELVSGALADSDARAIERPLATVEAAARGRGPAIDAIAALAPSEHVKIIAEVKRASPSRGALANIPDPALLAATYQEAGASAISVLTEQRKFRGSLADLEAVRAAVTVPVLRKDFIANRYQVFEARAAGADIVLLIVAALDQSTLASLHALSTELGMTTLVETHSAEEISRGLDAGARLLGVNARNLTTFQLDRELFGTLADHIPSGVIRVAESAVSTAADVAHYREGGADVVLVGEALVTSDPRVTLREFLAV
ncbi:indole-3-glycerol phosphate synthase TrpC [Rathayibacter soli]|uniref:indole-3-glycerol phosphate synthase TrpC n=1 Tax=Rathayibacter soli TaxID=3144168 RepID=UPI0027E470CE|nr:indole-3-glycerol phosphate synthase TrpC [Glaciibacter superstes]